MSPSVLRSAGERCARVTTRERRARSLETPNESARATRSDRMTHFRLDVRPRGRLRDRLDVIDAASTLEDIALPHFGLHELKGRRAGTWAVKVNKNWRLTFIFADGDASDVDFEDYH